MERSDFEIDVSDACNQFNHNHGRRRGPIPSVKILSDDGLMPRYQTTRLVDTITQILGALPPSM